MYSLIDLLQLAYLGTVVYSLYMLWQEDTIHKGKPIDQLSDNLSDVMKRQGVIIMSYVLCFIPLVNLFMLKATVMSAITDVLSFIADVLDRHILRKQLCAYSKQFSGTMTTGILVENRDLAQYKEALIRADMSDFSTDPFSAETTMIHLNISLDRLPDVQRICRRLAINLHHAN